ncbi:hypothetical protein [Bremerella sp.]|uniref:hypothetical protein n=1 Tax=Bremerella sp. TaxID=2795602 RepID=UPI00391A1702
MPSVLQIQKLCFHNLGRASMLLILTLWMVSTLSAAEPTTKPRLRIQPVVKKAQPASAESTPEVQVTAATGPAALKPVVRAAALTLFQEEPPLPEPMPTVEPPATPDSVPMVEAPMPMAETPVPPMAQPPAAPMTEPMTEAPLSPSDAVPSKPQPLPSIANDRGRLTGKPDSFFESLTPEDREILYDGKLANQFGIGRTFDYEVDGQEVAPPTNIAAKVFSQEPEENFPNGYHRDWYPMVAMWEAPAFYHRPLYFEEVNLERYGHTHQHLQPVYSAAHFFGNTLALPYKIGAYHPCERIYTLGHYRPGDCNPHDIHTTPFTWKGVVYTGAVYSGIGAAFP